MIRNVIYWISSCLHLGIWVLQGPQLIHLVLTEMIQILAVRLNHCFYIDKIWFALKNCFIILILIISDISFEIVCVYFLFNQHTDNNKLYAFSLIAHVSVEETEVRILMASHFFKLYNIINQIPLDEHYYLWFFPGQPFQYFCIFKIVQDVLKNVEPCMFLSDYCD